MFVGERVNSFVLFVSLLCVHNTHLKYVNKDHIEHIGCSSWYLKESYGSGDILAFIDEKISKICSTST